MAQTYTNTTTRTYTRARMHLIRVQFKSFAVRFGYTPELVDGLEAALEEQLVSRLVVYANTPEGETAASVSLRIDWVAHDELKETKEVSIDSRWRNDVSPQLGVFEESFEDFISEQGLVLDRRVGLSDHCRADPALLAATRVRLGLIPGGPISWKNNPLSQSERIRGLAELSTEILLADDE